MDYRLWFAAIGLTSTTVIVALHYAGRRAANKRILARGVLTEAEIVSCREEGSRFRFTVVTYRFDVGTRPLPVEATRRMEGVVRLEPGQRVPVRYLASHPSVSLLVPYERLHDAS